MKKLLSASEIVALKLPGFPTTKPAVLAMAKRENWYFEEKTGVGGTRRLYDVPAKYFPGADIGTSSAAGGVAGTIAAGSSKVDLKNLELAMRALDEWEAERGVKVSADRRPAVISILYDYLQRNEGEGLAVVLRALGAG